MRKNVYLALLLVIALSLGAWVAAPTQTAVAQSNQDQTSMCNHASTQLVGRSAELPHIKGLIHDICEFRVNLDKVPKHVSEFDKDFVEDSITSNTLELQSLQIALDHATNEEWRGQIQMMIDMHTSDLKMAIAVAKKIGADTEPDLTHASVYPETPDYDLGKRYENLVEEYLTPLQNAADAAGGVSTPTTVPTDMTTTPGIGDTPTAIPTEMTMTSTAMVPTSTATGMMTNTPAGTVTGTAIVTSPTSTLVGVTNTSVPTMTGTAVLASPTNTLAGVTNTPVPTITATATMVVASPTGSSTTLPTTPVGTVTAPPTTGTASMFDIVSLNIIDDEHVADVQAELVAERLVKNDELRAFAKHSADVTELHLMLMGDLKHRLIDNYTPPPPEFQADYQSPRRFEPK